MDNFVSLVVLGTAQDGGYPHTGCLKPCCELAWKSSEDKRLISSISIIFNNKLYLFDITPDIRYQLQLLYSTLGYKPNISGVFITHAHYGHYMGLLELGLEVMNTKNIPVYVMPKMKLFIESNAPFTQLIDLNNINLIELSAKSSIKLFDKITINSFQVPHRNEFSETVGYSILGQNKSALYLPDIDSWVDWEEDIIDYIRCHDIAFLDGTFYNKSEINNRNIEKIPHPSILDSIKKFSLLDIIDRKKVNFTHLNHTNNVLRKESEERKFVLDNGYNIAEDGSVYLI